MKKVKCPVCRGSGYRHGAWVMFHPCYRCKTTGQVDAPTPTGSKGT